VKTALCAVLAALMLLCGCGAKVIMHIPPPIKSKSDYRQEYTYGGKDAFYHRSYLRIVNASSYRIRIIKDGGEIPALYPPNTEIEIKVNNELYKDVWVHMRVAAFGRHRQYIGMVEKSFIFNGTGKQQVEQWVLRDWMFDHR